VKVDFPVRAGRAAVVKIHQEDGEPVPAGAVLRVRGQQEEVFVGRRGEAFVPGLEAANEVEVRWRGVACAFTLAVPPAANDEILRLGPVTCRRKP
jgi:outer membrane usher protein